MAFEFVNSPLPAAVVSPARRGFVILLGLTALGGLGWGGKAGYEALFAPPPGPSSRAPIVSVESALAVRGDFPVALTGLGSVTPVATSVVKSRISGQIQEINFREGQLVKAGDALAQVDPRPYRLALAQAQGQLQKDQALLENAERDLRRYETLRQQMKDAVSEQQIDTQRALIAQTQAAVAIDSAQVDQARLNLDYCRIVSPIDGRVGLRQIDQGNYVQANDANGVAVVTQLSPITVVFTLPASDLAAVLKPFRAGKELAVVAYDTDRARPLAQGRLLAIDDQIDATTGTLKLRAVFANEDERLYPNLFVNAELRVDELRHVVLAPSASLQHGAKGAFAYVVGQDNVVAARSLKAGPSNGANVVIDEGLQEGERVVTDGADRLREGSAVAAPRKTQAGAGAKEAGVGANEVEAAPRKRDGAS